MNSRPAILCPIDFSDASRGALRSAKAIAEPVGGRLVILAIEDPLLTEAVDLGTGAVWNPEDTRHELARFASRALHGNPLKGTDVDYAVTVGEPAKQILHVAQEAACDPIVMSLHGSPMLGPRMGSVTYRVLCLAPALVLALPRLPDAARGAAPRRRNTWSRAEVTGAAVDMAELAPARLLH